MVLVNIEIVTEEEEHLTKIKICSFYLQLVLTNPGPAVIQKLRSAKFTDMIGEDKIFLTVGDAVKKFAPKMVDNV